MTTEQQTIFDNAIKLAFIVSSLNGCKGIPFVQLIEMQTFSTRIIDAAVETVQTVELFKAPSNRKTALQR